MRRHKQPESTCEGLARIRPNTLQERKILTFSFECEEFSEMATFMVAAEHKYRLRMIQLERE